MTENKQTFKRIVSFGFALLVAFVFCLSAFPVKSFAEDISVTFIINNMALDNMRFQCWNMTNNSVLKYDQRWTSASYRVTFSVPANTPLQISISYILAGTWYYFQLTSPDISYAYGGSSYPLNTLSVPIVINLYRTGSTVGASSDLRSFCFSLAVDNSTPTPEPATPTPEPTPTAEPTPTPEPTFNPNYPTFDGVFNKFKDDANNAFNALWISWTTISGKFYSNLFIIALPIGLLLFSIVLGLFFGDD